MLSAYRIMAVLAFVSQSYAFAADKAEKIRAGEYSTKELLLLMDEDRNGMVSKQEFMKFMEAEFDALDINHNGLLDVSELTGVKVKRSNPTNHK